MKYLISLSLLAILLASCSNDNENSTTLNFNLKFGDNTLVMYEDVQLQDGTRLRITDVKGYVSDVTLLSGTESTRVSEVKYLELGDAHSDAEEAEEGYKWTVESDLTGAVDGITFDVGLPTELNDTRPADYNSSNDLSRASEYWTNWGSYIYFKVEGNADFDGNGAYESGENIVLHLGTELAYKSVNMSKSAVDGNMLIELDVENIFTNYDLKGMPTIHADLNEQVKNNIETLATNISNSFN